jgi:hypothetical protein
MIAAHGPELRFTGNQHAFNLNGVASKLEKEFREGEGGYGG